MIDAIFFLAFCTIAASLGLALAVALWAILLAAFWVRLHTSALGFVAAFYAASAALLLLLAAIS